MVTEAFEFLLRHGYAVLFVVLFVEQLGIPLPAIPFLLAAGALAGSGEMSFALSLLLSTLACLTGDVIWYGMGRHKGARVLQWLCRMALEPDFCVRRTENIFQRHGARTLLAAKFLPGVNTVAPPLAGMFHMGLPRFLGYDAAGSFLYGLTFISLGFAFSHQLEYLAERALQLGQWLILILAGLLALYVGWKIVQRRRFIKSLRVARVTPEEVKRRLDAGEQMVIVDLRQLLDVQADPVTLPGALRIEAEVIADRHHEIPRDREIILYCT